MSNSRIRSIMRRTSEATNAIESGIKQVGKRIQNVANKTQPTSGNDMKKVFSSLKMRINQGVRQLRGIGKTIKLRGVSRSRGRTRGRTRGRSRSRSRGRN
jgi:hypothetical protein